MTLPELNAGEVVNYTTQEGYGPLAAIVTQHIGGNHYHITLFRPPPYEPAAIQVHDVELAEGTEPGTITMRRYIC